MQIIKTIISAVVVVVVLAIARNAAAADFQIVAVVNSEVIVSYELQDRITIALRAARLKDSQEIREKLASQILEALIDEKLQAQEAKRLSIDINEEELGRAISSIESQNGFNPGEFDKFIAKHDLPKSAFVRQVKAQLLWQKLLLKISKPKIFISKEEISEFISRIGNEKENQEVFLSEILIPVSEPEQEEDARKLAFQLANELGSGGDFAAIAKQFSRSNTAGNGGKIGWFPVADLDATIREAVRTLKPGDYTQPLRTSSGYVIMKLEDSKVTDAASAPPDEEKVREFLVLKKLELEARRYMKNLRRAAFIERRI